MTGLFDMHCHIVPGVDDGSDSLEESKQLLQLEYEQGVRNIIVTPHFRLNMFETSLEKVRVQFERLREAAEEMGIRIWLGCEFHSTMEMSNLLKNRKVATMAGSRYLLLEFSGGDDKNKIRERTNTLISLGYRPILAHIERYEACKDLSFVEDLIDLGAKMQINADSVCGIDGWGVKRYCRKLMKEDMITFIGSDCHGIKERRPHMDKAYQYVSRKFGEDYANKIFIENPERILK